MVEDSGDGRGGGGARVPLSDLVSSFASCNYLIARGETSVQQATRKDKAVLLCSTDDTGLSNPPLFRFFLLKRAAAAVETNAAVHRLLLL